ncbi:unconventional myosin-XV-like [Stomoxys calcitrans]|nr:unconventional myosin-XV-like [Stomoxys calcitrans]
MARIAALLHRAADLSHVPAMKEIKFLLPKPALSIRETRPAQWVGLVQSAWPQIANLSPGQVKAQQFLNVLSAWPLFGSSFFAVKRIWAEEGPHVDDGPMWRDLILALNRRGVLFLDPNTHVNATLAIYGGHIDKEGPFRGWCIVFGHEGGPQSDAATCHTGPNRRGS